MSPLDSKGNKKSIKKYFHIKPSIIVRKKINISWISKIVLWTFAISITLSIISDKAISGINLLAVIAILLVFILTGIVFDIIGIAVATADEKPFHSMNSRKVKGALMAIKLIRHSEKVSSFCNDVIGDIVSIISGSTGAIITVHLITVFTDINSTIIAVLMTAIISSLTVGGKAIGKTVAINKSNSIVFALSILISFLIPKRFLANNK